MPPTFSLNGDGRDDYIYIDPADGEIYAWINRLAKDNVWQWQSLGRIAGGVGATNDTLQMVDIDGGLTPSHKCLAWTFGQ